MKKKKKKHRLGTVEENKNELKTVHKNDANWSTNFKRIKTNKQTKPQLSTGQYQALVNMCKNVFKNISPRIQQYERTTIHINAKKAYLGISLSNG